MEKRICKWKLSCLVTLTSFKRREEWWDTIIWFTTDKSAKKLWDTAAVFKNTWQQILGQFALGDDCSTKCQLEQADCVEGQLLGKEAGHQPVLSCPLVSCHRGHQQGEEEGGEEGGGGGHRQAGQDPRGAAGGAQLQQATEVWSGHCSLSWVELSTRLLPKLTMYTASPKIGTSGRNCRSDLICVAIWTSSNGHISDAFFLLFKKKHEDGLLNWYCCKWVWIPEKIRNGEDCQGWMSSR